MKERFATVGALAVICLFAWLVLKPRHHYPAAAGSTNWLGPVVFGRTAAGVVGGPFPAVDARIEIGLRNDGMIVWRRTGAEAADAGAKPK